MDIKFKPMGDYQTNCYILTIDKKDYIIDPGIDALGWIDKNTTNPVAILNTHGHFDHVWSNSAVKKKYNIPIYCPKDDIFMLQKDPFGYGVPKSDADFIVKPNETKEIENIKFKFRHFPGHTPGCSIIEIGNIWFSGDFLFKNSIGRWDFPYSSKGDMLNSLKKVQKIKDNYTVLPGHGEKTTLKNELRHIDYWIDAVRKS